MISEVDIRDWEKEIEKAEEALQEVADYRSELGYQTLTKFFDLVRRAHVKQVPALFKGPVNG